MASHQVSRMTLAGFVHKNDNSFVKPSLPLSALERKERAEAARIEKPLAPKAQNTETNNDAPSRHVKLPSRQQQSSHLNVGNRAGSPTPRGLFDSDYAGSDTTASSVHRLSLHDEPNEIVRSSMPNGHHRPHVFGLPDASPLKDEYEVLSDDIYRLDPNAVLDNVVSSLGMSGMAQRGYDIAGSYPATSDGVLPLANDQEMRDDHRYSDGNDYQYEDILPSLEPDINFGDREGFASQDLSSTAEVPNHHLTEEQMRQQHAAEQRQELNRDFRRQQVRVKQELRDISPFNPRQSSFKPNDQRRLSPSHQELDCEIHSDPTTPTRQRNGLISRKPAPTSPGGPHSRNGTNAAEPMPDMIVNQNARAEKQAPKLTTIDYDNPTLVAMKYTALQEESFDNEPGTIPFVLPDGRNEASLSERLSLVAKYTAADQRRFFDSLDITEWEQSGEWFTQQFSQVMDKMRRSRQERRSVATQFEKEVSERHDAVIREHASLESALAGMKKSGGAVLDSGTPKRKRG